MSALGLMLVRVLGTTAAGRGTARPPVGAPGPAESSWATQGCPLEVSWLLQGGMRGPRLQGAIRARKGFYLGASRGAAAASAALGDTTSVHLLSHCADARKAELNTKCAAAVAVVDDGRGTSQAAGDGEQGKKSSGFIAGGGGDGPGFRASCFGRLRHQSPSSSPPSRLAPVRGQHGISSLFCSEKRVDHRVSSQLPLSLLNAAQNKPMVRSPAPPHTTVV